MPAGQVAGISFFFPRGEGLSYGGLRTPLEAEGWMR